MIKSPYCAEFEQLNEDTGEYVERLVYVEDILPEIAEGKTVSDIMIAHNVTREIVEHLIMMIPHVMIWRDNIGGSSDIDATPQRLPR